MDLFLAGIKHPGKEELTPWLAHGQRRLTTERASDRCGLGNVHPVWTSQRALRKPGRYSLPHP